MTIFVSSLPFQYLTFHYVFEVIGSALQRSNFGAFPLLCHRLKRDDSPRAFSLILRLCRQTPQCAAQTTSTVHTAKEGRLEIVREAEVAPRAAFGRGTCCSWYQYDSEIRDGKGKNKHHLKESPAAVLARKHINSDAVEHLRKPQLMPSDH